MKQFVEIQQRAAERKGGEAALAALLPQNILDPGELAEIPDSRILSQMTKSIFQAGFNWNVIENKWPGFEAAFWEFDIARCLFMSPDDFDALCKDERIVRNPQKISTVSKNAAMIADAAKEHGSFAKMVAYWPEDDFIGLLAYLQKHGARLGGNTGAYVLRQIGRDGFVLSRDGVAALIEAGVIDKPPTGKAALKAVQEAYSAWKAETSLKFADISRILGLSIDAG